MALSRLNHHFSAVHPARRFTEPLDAAILDGNCVGGGGACRIGDS